MHTCPYCFFTFPSLSLNVHQIEVQWLYNIYCNSYYCSCFCLLKTTQCILQCIWCCSLCWSLSPIEYMYMETCARWCLVLKPVFSGQHFLLTHPNMLMFRSNPITKHMITYAAVGATGPRCFRRPSYVTMKLKSCWRSSLSKRRSRFFNVSAVWFNVG